MRLNSMLLLLPNWAKGVFFSRKWRTTIGESISGREKRSAVHKKVRRTIRYDAAAMDAGEVNYYHRKMFKYLHGLWGVPLWHDEALLTAQALAGSSILHVDSTENKDFVRFGYVVLFDESDLDLYEVHSIVGLGAAEIRLRDPLGYTWASGSPAYPVLVGRLKPTQTMSLLTNRIGTTRVEVGEEIFTTSSTITQTSTTSSTTTTS